MKNDADTEQSSRVPNLRSGGRRCTASTAMARSPSSARHVALGTAYRLRHASALLVMHEPGEDGKVYGSNFCRTSTPRRRPPSARIARFSAYYSNHDYEERCNLHQKYLPLHDAERT